MASWPAGTTYAFQWLRGATATTATTATTGPTSSTATTSSYTPNAADYNQFLRLKVTATVPGYNPVIRYSSPAKNYSLYTQSPVPATFAVAGTAKIGTEVTVNTGDLAFFDVGGNSISGVTLTYQWLRNGIPITDTPGTTLDATDDNDYTLRSGDYNANVSLRVTASKAGWVSKILATPNFKPTQLGTIQATSPAASVANAVDATAPLKVSLTASLSGVTEPELGVTTYQWYRVNLTSGVATAITGGTGVIYKPVAADVPYKLRVIATAKKLNYTSLALPYTRDFSLRLDPATPLGFNGSVVKVDNTITGSSPTWKFETAPGSYASTTLADPTLITAYQWRAAGLSLGAPGNAWSYGIVAANRAKVLSYTVTANYPAYLPYSGISPNTVAVAPATFSQLVTVPVMSTGLVKTVTAALTDVNPTATTRKVQWFRDALAIAGATGDDYSLVAADYGHAITVKVTYLRDGYTNYVANGDSGTTNQFWIRASAAQPKIVGVKAINGLLSVAPRTYEDMTTGLQIASGDISPTYQWYRSGVAIVGALGQGATYQPVALDKGKVITVRLTINASGYQYDLPSISTSVGTPPLGTNPLPGTDTLDPTLVVQGTSTDYATILGSTSTGITSPGGAANVVAYQWLRDGAPIALATNSTYTLAQADRGHLVGLRITTSHVAIGAQTYTTDIRYTNEYDYTLNANTAGVEIHVDTDMTVGSHLAPLVPMYTDSWGDPVPTSGLQQKFQWYRTAIVKKKSVTTAIPGATHSDYYIQAADLGATISVTVTTGAVGYIAHIATYKTNPTTLKVLIGALVNTATAPTVSMAVPATNTLKATPPDVQGQPQFPMINTQHATFKYQWYRDNPLDVTPPAAIVGATAQTYKLTALDSSRDVFVKATAVLAGYTSVTLPPSTPLNYNIKVITGSEPYASIGQWTPGNQPQVYGENFITKDGALASPTIKYQWLRNNVAIVGTDATDNGNYTLTPADVGKLVSVRLTVSSPGYLPLVYTTTPGQLVISGTTMTLPSVAIVPGAGNGTLTTSLTGLAPANPAPAYSYKWYRAGVVAPVSTAATYALVAADSGKSISVQVTMTRSGFSPAVTDLGITVAGDRTIRGDATLPTLTGTTSAGQTLTATPPPFFEADGTTALVATPTLTYAWYRTGVLIAGVTGDTYVLTGTDVTKKITVKVTASLPGRLAYTSVLSLATATIATGTIVPGSYTPVIGYTVIASPASTTAKVVSFTGTPTIPASGGFTPTYVWKRDGITIAGQTASSYKLVAADSGKEVTVSVTLTKSGFTPLFLIEIVVNSIIAAPGDSSIVQVNGVNTSTAAVGDTLTMIAEFYYLPETYPSVPNLDDSHVAYQWYRDGVAIPTATTATYVVKSGDTGTDIYCLTTVTAPSHAKLVDTTANHITIS